MSKKLCDKINSRGHANGWAAQQLAKQAAKQGETMAAVWLRSTSDSVAYNVPAKAIIATETKAIYVFLDGSEVICKKDCPPAHHG